MTADAKLLADKIDALQDDGSEGAPWSQEELDLIAKALRGQLYVPEQGSGQNGASQRRSEPMTNERATALRDAMMQLLKAIEEIPPKANGYRLQNAYDAVLDAIGSDATDAARYRWLRDQRPNSLSLTRNDHASNYRTAKEWIEDDMPENFTSEPPEAIQAMKDANVIWCLQIYPTTPIGFNWWFRATLDEAIDAAMSECESQPRGEG